MPIKLTTSKIPPIAIICRRLFFIVDSPSFEIDRIYLTDVLITCSGFEASSIQQNLDSGPQEAAAIKVYQYCPSTHAFQLEIHPDTGGQS